MKYLVAFFSLILFSALAQAGGLRGHEEACSIFASNAKAFIYYRDQGVSWHDMSGFVAMTLAEAKSDKDSFIKDDDDEALVYQLVKLGWDDPKMSQQDLGQAIFNGCMSGHKKQS